MKVLVLDSAVFSRGEDNDNYKDISIKIFEFLFQKNDFEVEIAKINGGRELIRVIDQYDAIVMIYESCLSDAIIISEKYPDIKYILISEYVNRQKLAFKKDFSIVDSKDDDYLEKILYYVKDKET